MKILLDTHTFLWGITAESRIPPRVRQIISAEEPWLSVVSVWEILIKVRLGKLDLPKPTGDFLVSRLAFNGVQVLPVTLDHVRRVENLPVYHNDPFDRLIIAQGTHERWPIVTADPWFARYPVELIW